MDSITGLLKCPMQETFHYFKLAFILVKKDALIDVRKRMLTRQDPFLNRIQIQCLVGDCRDGFFILQIRRMPKIGFVERQMPLQMVLAHRCKECASRPNQRFALSSNILLFRGMIAKKQNRKRSSRQRPNLILPAYAFITHYQAAHPLSLWYRFIIHACASCIKGAVYHCILRVKMDAGMRSFHRPFLFVVRLVTSRARRRLLTSIRRESII